MSRIPRDLGNNTPSPHSMVSQYTVSIYPHQIPSPYTVTIYHPHHIPSRPTSQPPLSTPLATQPSQPPTPLSTSLLPPLLTSSRPIYHPSIRLPFSHYLSLRLYRPTHPLSPSLSPPLTPSSPPYHPSLSITFPSQPPFSSPLPFSITAPSIRLEKGRSCRGGHQQDRCGAAVPRGRRGQGANSRRLRR